VRVGEVLELARRLVVPGEGQRRLQVHGDELGDAPDAVEVRALVAVARVDPEAHERGPHLRAGLDGRGDVGAVVVEDVPRNGMSCSLHSPRSLRVRWKSNGPAESIIAMLTRSREDC
jgi:hypothetical protein